MGAGRTHSVLLAYSQNGMGPEVVLHICFSVPLTTEGLFCPMKADTRIIPL